MATWQSVVVNYKTAEDLDGFLTSYAEHGPAGGELVIVNNSPEPPDTAVAHQFALTNEYTTCLDIEENMGFAGAVNLAVALSSAPLIAIFNADTRIVDGTFERIEGAFTDEEEWGVIGPRQVDDAGRITHGGVFGTNAAPELRGWQEIDQGQYSEIEDNAVSVSGSAYFIRRSVWDELTQCPIYRRVVPSALGAFLPTPHYFEETWCSYHARSHGHSVVYYGPVRMVHRWHKASPVGGFAEDWFPISQALFRLACDAHRLAHD